MAKPAALEGIDLTPEPSKLRSLPPPQTVHELQAAVDGVAYGDTVEFMGEKYRIADAVGLMPLMRFAYFARQGIHADDIEGLAAMYDLIRTCLADDEWERFEADAIDKRADEEALLEVVTATIEVLSARPTRRPSGSSDGPSATSPNSTESSSSPDTPTGDLEAVSQTMPDLVSVDRLVQAAGG